MHCARTTALYMQRGAKVRVCVCVCACVPHSYVLYYVLNGMCVCVWVCECVCVCVCVYLDPEGNQDSCCVFAQPPLNPAGWSQVACIVLALLPIKSTCRRNSLKSALQLVYMVDLEKNRILRICCRWRLLCSRRRKFFKISLLLNVLCKLTIELTFENLWQMAPFVLASSQILQNQFATKCFM